MGQTGGADSVTLSLNQLAAHSHGALAFGRAGDTKSPSGADWAKPASDTPYGMSSPPGAMSAAATSAVGGGQPHENRQPYLVLNYVIALRESSRPEARSAARENSMGRPDDAPSARGDVRVDPVRRLGVVPVLAEPGGGLDRADDLPGGQGRHDRLGRPAGDPAVPRLPQADGPGRRRPADAPGHAPSGRSSWPTPPCWPTSSSKGSRAGTMRFICRGSPTTRAI